MVDLFDEGIAFYDPAKDSFTKIPLNNEDPEGLHGIVDWGTVTLKDRDGNMWVSGYDKGLNVFNPSKVNSHSIDQAQLTNSMFRIILLTALCRILLDGDVYVGYYHPSGGYRKIQQRPGI